MKDRIFFIVVFSVITGVAFHSFFFINPYAIYALFLTGAVLFLFFKYIQKLPLDSFQICVSLCLVFISFGLFRFSLSEPYDLSTLETRVESTVILQGVIADEPDMREKVMLLPVQVAEPVKTKILITTERYPEYKYGDVISFSGILEKPKTFETETGKIVNYPAYLAKDGIYHTLFKPDITVIDRGQGNIIREKLFAIKRFFLLSVEKVISPPESSLLAGLLLGENSLPKDLNNLFRISGIVHIVVLSGYNITIVANTIMAIFSFLGRKKLWVGSVTIVLFAVMTGGSATVVRASLMALLVILAQASYRVYAITRALLLAGMVMVIHNPKILIFDFSFQLSFLATLGLVLVSPIIEKYFHFVPGKMQLREIVVATFATQIFVLPLLLFATGEFSIVGLFTNLLVLPLIPFTMLVGFFIGIVGMLSGVVALPLGFVAHMLLGYEIWIASFFGSLPWASLAIPYFPAWLMAFSYLILALFFSLFYWHQAQQNSLTR